MKSTTTQQKTKQLMQTIGLWLISFDWTWTLSHNLAIAWPSRLHRPSKSLSETVAAQSTGLQRKVVATEKHWPISTSSHDTTRIGEIWIQGKVLSGLMAASWFCVFSSRICSFTQMTIIISSSSSSNSSATTTSSTSSSSKQAFVSTYG